MVNMNRFLAPGGHRTAATRRGTSGVNDQPIDTALSEVRLLDLDPRQPPHNRSHRLDRDFAVALGRRPWGVPLDRVEDTGGDARFRSHGLEGVPPTRALVRRSGRSRWTGRTPRGGS